jgi:hypothetical protein
LARNRPNAGRDEPAAKPLSVLEHREKTPNRGATREGHCVDFTLEHEIDSAADFFPGGYGSVYDDHIHVCTFCSQKLRERFPCDIGTGQQDTRSLESPGSPKGFEDFLGNEALWNYVGSEAVRFELGTGCGADRGQLGLA